MTARALALALLVAAALLPAACGGDNFALCDGCTTPTPTPSVSATPTTTVTPTPTPAAP